MYRVGQWGSANIWQGGLSGACQVFSGAHLCCPLLINQSQVPLWFWALTLVEGGPVDPSTHHT